MLSTRVPDPTGLNVRGIMLAPARDIAHMYPFAIRQAIQLASDRVDKMTDVEIKERINKELCDVAVGLAKWVKMAATDTQVTDWRQALVAAGLDKASTGRAVFYNALADVMFQIYFQGIREALHGEKPLGFAELMKFVEERTDGLREQN